MLASRLPISGFEREASKPNLIGTTCVMGKE
jgi:hypothetical protein